MRGDVVRLVLLAGIMATPARAEVDMERLSAEEALVIASQHVASAGRGLADAGVGDWLGAEVVDTPTPVYRRDLGGVAYWEFKVARNGSDAGFVLVATGVHDFPVQHWRTAGPAPSAATPGRTPAGRAAPDRLIKTDALAYEWETAGTPEALPPEQQAARDRYFATLRLDAMAVWQRLRAPDRRADFEDGDWETWQTPGPSPAYGQIEAGQAPNDSGCLSGCGATAWAILFGWADIQATKDPAWAHASGIYREGGGLGVDAVAPEVMDAGVANMSWEIRQNLGTWCTQGQGATGPWNMGGAQAYLSGRAAVRLDWYYNAFGIAERRLADHAIGAIANRRTPAVIGTGWLKHYPVATAYARRPDGSGEWFYVNQGWSGGGNDWVAVSTWFSGTLLP